MKQLSILNLSLSFIALMLFWLVMSGKFQFAQIGQGIICAFIVIAVNYRLKHHAFYDDEMDDLAQLRFHYAPVYVLWLIKEIILAGLHVASVIVMPNRSVKTYVLTFRVDLPSAHARMILGNSITLTPGTITLDITDDKFIVHAITPDAFGGIVDDTMPRRVLKLFSKEDRPVIHDITYYHDADKLPWR